MPPMAVGGSRVEPPPVPCSPVTFPAAPTPQTGQAVRTIRILVIGRLRGAWQRPYSAARTRPLRPSPPRRAGWRARGSPPPGSGGAVLPALDVAGVLAADRQQALDRVGGAQRARQGRRHAQPQHGEGLGQPLAQARRGAGVGLVELPGQRQQLGFGVQRGGGVVGGAHAVLDRTAQPLGQLVTDVSELVLLASGDHGMVEDVGNRAAQRLGAVQDAQDRPGHLQATLAQPHQQVTGQGGVLGGALHQRQRVLGPVDGDPQRHHAAVLPEVDPVDHQAHQVQPAQVGGQQLCQRGVGHGHKPPRHRRLAGARRGLLDLGADRLKAQTIAASRQAAEHPLQCQPAQDLGGREQLVGGDGKLARAVGGTDPGTLHRDPPSPKGHRAVLVAVADRGPVRVVLALGTGQRVHRLLHQRPQHLQPGAHGQRQQALLGRLGDLGQRDRDLVWDGQLRRARGGVPGLVLLAHGGPLPCGALGGSPETYQTAGLRWGTATSRSTNRGTTSAAGLDRTQRAGRPPSR